MKAREESKKIKMSDESEKINALRNKSATYKMETKTVKELQAIAKQQKLRGYSRLRKAELITLLNEAPQQLWGAVETKDRLLLDEPVPSISIPILQPTPAATHSATRSAKPSFYNRLNNFKVLGTKIKS